MTIKLEAGKYYRRRDNKIVGPTLAISFNKGYSWVVDSRTYADSGHYWKIERESFLDLIEEVLNPNEEHTACPYAAIEVLKREVGRAQADRDEMVDEVARLEKHAHQLSTDNVTLRARVEKLDANRGGLLGYHLDEIIRERDDLKARVEELNEEGEGFKQTLTQLAQENTRIETRLASVSADRDIMRGERDDLGREVEKLETHLAVYEKVATENASLKAELEALKPKPVVVVLETGILYREYAGTPDVSIYSVQKGPPPEINVRLTFHDGVLVSAEVLK